MSESARSGKLVKPRLCWTVGAVVLLVLVIVGGLSAQSAQDRPSSIADLLTEVRGLRADVNRTAGASIRMQLLIARVSLQEQRIDAVVRELTEAQRQLATASREKADLEGQVKRLEEGISARTTPQVQVREMEDILPQLKADLSQRQSSEQQLRTHAAELTALLASERSRWTDLNNRLDDLERGLPAVEQH